MRHQGKATQDRTKEISHPHRLFRHCCRPPFRPAFGLSPATLDGAFAALADKDMEGGISSSTLLELLQERGERMSEEELAQVLGSLLGDSRLDQLLPATITADNFARDVVGLVQ